MDGDYEQARKQGLREYNARQARGENPLLQSLDELVPHLSALTQQKLGLEQIPFSQLGGTSTKGRAPAFAANFMPILEPDSEFAGKWQKLLDSVILHGVEHPVTALEYMNKYYIVEGNKRVSVMLFLGAVSIEAEVTRVVPRREDTHESRVYQEYMGFYQDTRINDILFSREGGYARLREHLGKHLGDKWSDEEISLLRSAFRRFSKVFHKAEHSKLDLTDGDAFLIYLDVFGYARAKNRLESGLISDVRSLSDEFRTQASDEPVALLMEPVAKPAGLLASVLHPEPQRLRAAFVHARSAHSSGWIYAHELGRGQVDEKLGDRVETVKCENVTADETESTIERLIDDGFQVVFTTSPTMLQPAARAAVRHPEARILNCSLLALYHHVRTYYLRVYEAKFIIGALAGALADSDQIGYIADYPIFGTPASINAFAQGVRLTNPRARVHLEWSSLKGHDPLAALESKGVSLISNRDISAPGHLSRAYGLYRLEDGDPVNLAMPIWNWGTLYETLLLGMMDGTWRNQENEKSSQALHYWWGISSGAIDVICSQRLDPGTRRLKQMLFDGIGRNQLHPFAGLMKSQDGVVRCAEDGSLTPAQILTMDYLADNVVGAFPTLSDVRDEFRPLVELQGVGGAQVPPDPEAFSWTDGKAGDDA